MPRFYHVQVHTEHVFARNLETENSERRPKTLIQCVPNLIGLNGYCEHHSSSYNV